MSVVDGFDARRARRATGVLRAFNEVGLLGAADVHVARRLGALAGEGDEAVLLAAALAVRAPRLGHVHVDLATIRRTATVDQDEPVDLSRLPWPDEDGWPSRVAASPLVGQGALRLEGSWLYLDRYWREELQVADDLRALSSAASADEPRLRAGVARLFADDPEGRQALAAATAVRRRLAVVAGGPGTGKTTTVARVVALVAEQALGAAGAPGAAAPGSAAARLPLVALAAPTGKAAARLQAAVHEEAGRLDVAPEVRGHLLGLRASTLHRLLGRRPDSHSRFRHHRGNRLPHDVVIVDETSMVSLSLMARLVEAVRPDARLVLVGDPDQLTSIEAGAVLGDVALPGGDGVVVLERVHRFGGGIAAVAEAVRAGDADAAVAALRAHPDDVTWVAADPATAGEVLLRPVREGVVATARAITTAARAGDAGSALGALGTFRVLCAHRRGPHGVAGWTARIERWLAAAIDHFAAEGRWYSGRPLLVTENDYELRLYNGDTGVVVATPAGKVRAAFGSAAFSPSRLGAVETVYAMTVHKAQGSQFGTAAVLLPDATSRLLTRELLYTAVTRAQERLLLVGTEDAVRTAVGRPAARASGLASRLSPGARPVATG